MPDVAFQIKNSLGLADYGAISLSLQDYLPRDLTPVAPPALMQIVNANNSENGNGGKVSDPWKAMRTKVSMLMAVKAEIDSDPTIDGSWFVELAKKMREDPELKDHPLKGLTPMKHTVNNPNAVSFW